MRLTKIPSVEMIFTEEYKINYNSARVCWVSEEGFPEDAEGSGDTNKVQDHCHF